MVAGEPRQLECSPAVLSETGSIRLRATPRSNSATLAAAGGCQRRVRATSGAQTDPESRQDQVNKTKKIKPADRSTCISRIVWLTGTIRERNGVDGVEGDSQGRLYMLAAPGIPSWRYSSETAAGGRCCNNVSKNSSHAGSGSPQSKMP